MLKKIKSKLSKDANLKELVSGSAITFILKMSGMVLGFVVFDMIAEKNGSEGAGYYALVNQLLMLLGTIAALGTNISVLRYVGQYNNPDDASQMHPLYRNVLKSILPFSILLGGCVFIFAENIALSFFHNSEYTEAIRIVGIVLPFTTSNRVGVEFVRGLKKLKISEFTRSVSRPLIMIVCILAFWNQDIPNIYIIYFIALAMVINALLSNGTIVYYLQKIKRPKTTQLNQKELLKVSSPMMITSISTTLMAALSPFLIEYFSETDKVGIYAGAFRISQLIAIVLVVVNTIAAPKFSELFWANKKQELQKVIRQSVKLMFWSSLGLSLVVVIASEPILNIFGKEFIGGQSALIVLVCGQLFNAATGSVGLFLNMSGNQKILRNTALIALTLQCVIAAILIPILGILGAAIASTVAGALWNLMCILYVRKKLNLKTYYLPFIK
jgi:O-antigen/teichoic acid export membrane protein